MSEGAKDMWGPIGGAADAGINVPTAVDRRPATSGPGSVVQVPRAVPSEVFTVDPNASLKGRGPKGYAPSDDRIKHVIEDLMAADATLDPGDIEVSVKKGEVTLSGSVAGPRARYAAVAIAKAAAGVKRVHDKLEIPPEP